VWIKVTSAVILALLVIALSRFPSSVGAAVYYERGKQAEQQLRYVTAANDYKKASEHYRDSPIILGRLFLAYYHSEAISEAGDILHQIGGTSPGDKDLIRDVNNAGKRMQELYYSSKELQSIMENKQSTPEKRVEELKAYLKTQPANIPAIYDLADTLFDVKNYDESLKQAHNLIQTASDFEPAYLLAAASFREKGDYESALKECQAVFARNAESYGAYYAKSRIELKAHQDQQGLEDALAAVKLMPDDPYGINNLALAYHYNGNKAERDKLVQKLESRKDYPPEELQRLKDTIDGKLQWRK
jgi:tetratricopeptide (TPR) repeat protein